MRAQLVDTCARAALYVARRSGALRRMRFWVEVKGRRGLGAEVNARQDCCDAAGSGLEPIRRRVCILVAAEFRMQWKMLWDVNLFTLWEWVQAISILQISGVDTVFGCFVKVRPFLAVKPRNCVLNWTIECFLMCKWTSESDYWSLMVNLNRLWNAPKIAWILLFVRFEFLIKINNNILSVAR